MVSSPALLRKVSFPVVPTMRSALLVPVKIAMWKLVPRCWGAPSWFGRLMNTVYPQGAVTGRKINQREITPL